MHEMVNCSTFHMFVNGYFNILNKLVNKRKYYNIEHYKICYKIKPKEISYLVVGHCHCIYYLDFD